MMNKKIPANIVIITFIFLFSNSMAYDSIRIIGVGDIMPGTTYPEPCIPPDNGVHLFDNVKHILKDSDVTFGNLEGTLIDAGETVKICSDPLKCYVFRIPERYVNLLTDAGFDVLSLANNHIGDFGDFGRKNSMQVLKKAGIYFAGLVSCPEAIFEINGIKYGFCAFAPNIATTDIRDIKTAQNIVRKLDKKADIVIVSFHGGAEGANYRHVPRKTEIFYNEDRGNVCKFSHQVIDAGADVVFGHGPHITRAVEVYKDKFIAYSLGNFCTWCGFNLNGLNGIAPIIKVNLEKSGKFISARIYPIKQERGKSPFIDPDSGAIKQIAELTAEDFPDTKLTITKHGEIRIKE